MPSGSVARRYAQGTFELAREENDIDGWRKEMARLDELLSDDVLEAAFRNPAVGTGRRMELARRLAPELKPQAANLLRLLIEHQRTSAMPEIRQEFERLADEASGVVHATLTTAVPVGEDQRRAYQDALGKRLKREVRLRVTRDPSLIGGGIVQIGDHVTDGSIRMRLQRLRQAIIGA